MTTATRNDRGWTRHPKIARILKRGVARFITIYPWAELHPTFNPERDICFIMLTAREILKLNPSIPASMAPQYGHNHGPSWEECVRLAEATRHCALPDSSCRWRGPTKALTWMRSMCRNPTSKIITPSPLRGRMGPSIPRMKTRSNKSMAVITAVCGGIDRRKR